MSLQSHPSRQGSSSDSPSTSSDLTIRFDDVGMYAMESTQRNGCRDRLLAAYGDTIFDPGSNRGEGSGRPGL
jgi:hypothetical protein